jgi:hypothetical protein
MKMRCGEGDRPSFSFYQMRSIPLSQYEKITKETNIVYKLEKYAPAFAMLGPNYVALVPDEIRQILIFTALNVNWGGKNSVLAVLSNMFNGLNTNNLKNCLQRIVDIHYEHKAKRKRSER